MYVLIINVVSCPPGALIWKIKYLVWSCMVFYTWQQVNVTIYRTVYLHTNMCKRYCIQNKKIDWATIALFHCCNLIWGLTNNNYSLFFFSFWLTVSIYVCVIFSFPSYIYSWTVEQIGIYTYFFCWRLHKYDFLHFVWY